MKAQEFNKLLKEYKDNLQRIIYLHCENKIYLTNYQLDKVIKMRGDRDGRNKINNRNI